MIKSVAAVLAQIPLPSVEQRMLMCVLALCAVLVVILGCDVGEYLMDVGVLPTNMPIRIVHDPTGVNDGCVVGGSCVRGVDTRSAVVHVQGDGVLQARDTGAG